ncbi:MULTISPECIES: alkaline phosphatase family protein [Dyella]|uniref:Alkaline phosphatase family protein n=2 Tax=Dyella TaxID=231454 RepID=A0A4V2NKV1_9GAMM|nr:MULTISPECIES: ectonucleotide pyrophosphatase/phosphodiesterase [Dyella]TBR36129.1 alkaline phosphatase family protein [Dyella terrae]TCI06178.1 alkaline phosphatase family protein [Dyella soli]
MRFLPRCAALAMLAVASLGTAQAVPVLLISIDGLRPGDVLEARQRGMHLPNLSRFVKEGSYAAGVQGVLPTLTYPSHTTLITGVSPNVHGIGGNFTFDPINENQEGWAWYASDIRVPTLWDAAHAAGLTTGNVHWPVSVGANIDWNLPQIWRAGTPDDRKLLAALSTPGLLAPMERELGPYADGVDESIEADANRARFAVRLLEEHHPDFMTTYFASLDHQEHANGPDSEAARRTLEQLDRLVGELVEAAQRVHPDGVVAVVSDHGFLPVKHDVNLYAPFIKVGLITVKDGQIADWKVVPWNDGGSAAIVLRDPSDEAVKARVGAILDDIRNNPDYGIARVLDKDALVAKGGTSQATWFITLKPGYEATGRINAPVPSDSPVHGMHGYDPSEPAMRSVFMMLGKGVPEGRDLGVIDMRDIAPTLASWMGVSLTQARSHPLIAP